MRKGLVIFAHEFGMDRWSHSRYTRALRQAGYDVFAFDFRGHGQSPPESGYKPRQFPSDREVDDMLGAIAFAEVHLRQTGREVQVGILGVSRGGGAAILASIDVPSVRAVAVDGAFSSDRVLQFLIRRWASIFVKLRFTYEAPPLFYWRLVRWFILSRAESRFGCRFPSVCKALRRLDQTATLFIHGERDTFVPLEQAQWLYLHACEPKYLWTVPRARHNQSVARQPAEYGRKLAAFFDRHLAGIVPEHEPQTETMTELAQPIEERLALSGPGGLPGVVARRR